MHAIIETGGKQYRVTVGDLVDIERLPAPTQKSIDLPVLMIENGDQVQIGSPTVKGAQVTAEVVRELKDKKITIYRYKRRKGFDRKQGHRQTLTQIRITDIKTP